jgi:Cytochrome C'
MRNSLVPIAAVVAAISLPSCSQRPPPPAEVTRELQPIATIQEIMHFGVEPSAFGVWESVSSETTAQGTVDKSPQTDAEWAQVRGHAVMLAEAANLLLVKGRHVVTPGKTLEDADAKGISTPEEIERTINEAPDQFYSFAQALQAATQSAIKAIDARDTAALVAAGGAIDTVCEDCHSKFWYPHSAPPPAK